MACITAEEQESLQPKPPAVEDPTASTDKPRSAPGDGRLRWKDRRYNPQDSPVFTTMALGEEGGGWPPRQ